MKTIQITGKRMDLSEVANLAIQFDHETDTVKFILPSTYDGKSLPTSGWGVRYQLSNTLGDIDLVEATLVEGNLEIEYSFQGGVVSRPGLVSLALQCIQDGKIVYQTVPGVIKVARQIDPSNLPQDEDILSRYLQEFADLLAETSGEKTLAQQAAEAAAQSASDAEGYKAQAAGSATNAHNSELAAKGAEEGAGLIKGAIDSLVASAPFQAVVEVAPSIPAVAEVAEHIPAVAGAAGSIPTVAGVADELALLAPVADEIEALALIVADITSVSGVKADVSAVAAKLVEVQAVYAKLQAIEAVAGRTTEIDALYAQLDTIAAKASQADLDAVEDRLDTLEGTGAGSVAKAIDDAVSPLEEDITDHESRISKLEFIPAVTSWADVQRIVREGRASAYFPVGTQFEATWNGISVVWDVIGINHDKPTDPTYTRSLTIQANKILRTGRISGPEAMYNAVTELPAGTYIFTTNGVQYTFTSTQAVPAGGVIYIKTRSDYVPLTLTIYGAGRTTIVEDNIAVTATTGTDNLSPINGHVRMRYGNNNYEISALRQWLNSDSAAFAWQPLGLYDMPSSYSTQGFLNILDPDLKAVIGAVDKQVAKAMYDGGGQSLFSDKVFLLSRKELFGDDEGTVTGEAQYSFWTGRTNKDRIKTNLSNSIGNWWLRSPGVSGTEGTWGVLTSGALGNISVLYAHGLAPACVIY